MGFWRGLAARFLRDEVKEMTSSLELFREIYGAPPSKSGATVTAQSALEVSTVLACCRSIANGVAQVPFRLYLDAGSGRSLAKEHPLFRVLYRRPNPWQTSFEFRETVMFHILLTGNAFVFVNRVGIARTVRELIPIEPGRVTVKQLTGGALEYTVINAQGVRQVFGSDAIWHLRGPSWNSWMGLESTRLAREAIGLSVALEQGQAEFQKNGAKTTGLYSVKSKLSPEKYALLRAWFDGEEGAGRAPYKPLIVDDDASYTPFTMTGVDQQLIETRKHQIEEICREFGVMPIMVGHADKTATYASAEQMFLAHVIHTLSPWYERIEQSADVNLLSEGELADGYYSKFTPNALMRGAANDRANFYAKALGAGGTKGWMTQNDVRGFEDMDRDPDPEADKLPQPTNRAPASAPPSGGPEEDDPDA